MDLTPLTARGLEPAARPSASPPAGRNARRHPGAGRGNPLALVEFTRAAAADPAAAAGWPGQALPLTERLQRSFAASALALPEPTRRALLLAAADDNLEMNLSYLSGSLGVRRRLGTGAGRRAHRHRRRLRAFPHPLIRSAIYQGASPADRGDAHRALAAALDHRPDRQAWQLAAAATGPDEELARRLRSLAEDALVRDRIDTAVAAWQRAAELSPDPRDAAARCCSARPGPG